MAIFENAIAIDIGSRTIKGIVYKYALGELQILDCQKRALSDFKIPPELLEFLKEQDEEEEEEEQDLVEEEISDEVIDKGEKNEEPINPFLEKGIENEEALDNNELEPETAYEKERPKQDVLEISSSDSLTNAKSIIGYILQTFISDFWNFEYSFLVNLPSDKIFIRDISVPFNDPKKVLEVLPFELESLISISVDSCIVETSLWGKNPEGGATSLTFAIPEEKVLERSSFFILNQLPLKNISVDAVSLSRLVCDYTEKAKSILCAQLDIGGSYSIFNLIRNGELVFTRTLNIGGDDFSYALENILNVEPLLAEEIKLKLDIDLEDLKSNDNEVIYKLYKISKPKLAKIHSHFLEIVDDLISELALSLSASAATNDLDTIYLSGGASRMDGLASIIADKLQLKNPLSILDYRYIEKFPEPSGIDIYANSIGMILHQTISKKRKVNFLKGSLKSLFRKTSNWKVLKTPLIFLAASFFIFTLSYILNLMSLKETLTIVQKKEISVFEKSFNTKYNSSKGDVLSLAKGKVKKLKIGGIIDPVLSNNKYLPSVKLITDNMPDDSMVFIFKMLEYKGKGDYFLLTGIVSDFAAVTKVREQLMASKAFKDVIIEKKVSAGKLNSGKIKASYKIVLKESKKNAK